MGQTESRTIVNYLNLTVGGFANCPRVSENRKEVFGETRNTIDPDYTNTTLM